MTWWQALTILMQGVSAGAPTWVLLWAVDRLSAGGSTPEEAESLLGLPVQFTDNPAMAGRLVLEVE